MRVSRHLLICDTVRKWFKMGLNQWKALVFVHLTVHRKCEIIKANKTSKISLEFDAIWTLQNFCFEKLTSNTDHICLLNSQKRLFNFFSFSKSQNYCRLPMAVAVSSTHLAGLNHCANQIPFAGTYWFTQLLIWYSSQPHIQTHMPQNWVSFWPAENF